MSDTINTALLAGLLNDEQLRLYRTSQTFYQGMNVLVGMLPTWIEGMEINARTVDARRELAIRAATGRL